MAFCSRRSTTTRSITMMTLSKIILLFTSCSEVKRCASTKRREGFKQMVADALDGQIDLIITKSVSRFARNTVDSWHGLVDYATVYSEYDIRFTFKNGQEIKA